MSGSVPNPGTPIVSLPPYTVWTPAQWIAAWQSKVDGTNPVLNGTLTGTALPTYLASPPAIGSVAPNTGAFTTLGASGALTASGGGVLGGTFTGNPTLSGNPIFSGAPNFSGTGGTIAGTWASSATFHGQTTFSNAGAGSLAIECNAWLANFGWINVSANSGTITWSSGTPGTPVAVFQGNVAGQAGAATTPSQFQFNVASDTIDASLTTNGWATFASTTNIANGAKGFHTGMQVTVNQAGTLTSGDVDGLNVWLTISGTGGGNAIAFNPQVNVTNTASGVGLVETIEGAPSIASGVTGVSIRGGVAMASGGNVQGSLSDYGYATFGDSGAVGFRTSFQVGRYNSNWPVSGTGATLFGTQVQTNATGWTNQAAAYGLRMSDVEFTGAAIWTPGFQVAPAGALLVGAGSIAPNATGLAIDAKNYVGSTPTVSNAGASYAGTDHLYDEVYGGVFSITVNGSGNITALAVVQAPYAYGGAGTSTLALSGGSGTGAAVAGISWTQETVLSIGTSGTTSVILGSSSAPVAIGGSGAPTLTSGAGAPAGTQPNGSLYLRNNGAASTRLYVSEGGGTWSAIASS